MEITASRMQEAANRALRTHRSRCSRTSKLIDLELFLSFIAASARAAWSQIRPSSSSSPRRRRLRDRERDRGRARAPRARPQRSRIPFKSHALPSTSQALARSPVTPSAVATTHRALKNSTRKGLHARAQRVSAMSACRCVQVASSCSRFSSSVAGRG